MSSKEISRTHPFTPRMRLEVMRRYGVTQERVAGLYADGRAPLPKFTKRDVAMLGKFLLGGYISVQGGTAPSADATTNDVLEQVMRWNVLPESAGAFRGPNLVSDVQTGNTIDLGGMALWVGADQTKQ